MYYSEVDGIEPTISTQVGGIKYTFTNESLTKLIEEKESLKIELIATERKFKSAQFDVREHFQARYDTEQLEILSEVTDVNELLVSIGSEALTKAWSATVTITATVTGIEAPNKDAAEDIIRDSIDLNMNTDGDIWVDDMTVESVYPEA
jgi:ketol-acid reductoisomerase